MNELPDVGDFARIVEGCACGENDDCLGEIAFVSTVTGEDWGCECEGCGKQILGRMVHSFQFKPGECYPHAWMRKMPPDRQVLEEIEREAVPA